MSKAVPRYSQGKWPASTSLCSSGKWCPGSGYQAGLWSSWSRYCPQKEWPHSPVLGSHRYRGPAACIHNAVPPGTAPKTAPKESVRGRRKQKTIWWKPHVRSYYHSRRTHGIKLQWMHLFLLDNMKTMRPVLSDNKAWGSSCWVLTGHRPFLPHGITSLLLLRCLLHTGNENIGCVNDKWRNE